MVANQLQARGVQQYLPTITEIHRWSDRRKHVELALFPGYVFVRLVGTNERRVQVLRVPGVVRFVGPELGLAIPDDEIEAVKTLIDRNLPWSSHPFLKAGQRVRVRGGALDGVEGVFLKRNGEDSLIISINAIQRSLAVSVQGYDVETL